MSSTPRYLYRSIIRISSRSAVKRNPQKSFAQPQCYQSRVKQRPFSSLPQRFAAQKSKDDADTEQGEELDESEYQTPLEPYTVADLDPEERATFETLTKPEQQKYLKLQNHVKAVLESSESAEVSDKEAEKLARTVERESDMEFRETRNLRALEQGFWAEDEDDEFGQVEDDDDESSDEHITSVAESELELKREIREYYRIAAWELPLLGKFARPFTPPTKEQVLRFRYTTYMGEHHPAGKKVVCEFKVDDLSSTAGLSASQRRKLVLLAGVRYSPEHDMVRLSCEKFENSAQNKRYLGELVQKMIQEAKNSNDMFEDVPTDVRHVKEKRKVRFPKEWMLNNESQVKKLLEARQKSGLLGPSTLQTPAAHIEEGNEPTEQGEAVPVPVVNGKTLVGAYVRQKSVVNAALR